MPDRPRVPMHCVEALERITRVEGLVSEAKTSLERIETHVDSMLDRMSHIDVSIAVNKTKISLVAAIAGVIASGATTLVVSLIR